MDLIMNMELQNVIVLQSQIEKVYLKGNNEKYINLKQLIEVEDNNSYYVFADLL